MNIKKLCFTLFTLSLCLININSFTMGAALQDIRAKLVYVKKNYTLWPQLNDKTKQETIKLLNEIETSLYANKAQKHEAQTIRAQIESLAQPHRTSATTSNILENLDNYENDDDYETLINQEVEKFNKIIQSGPRPVTPQVNEDEEFDRAIALSLQTPPPTQNQSEPDEDFDQAIALSLETPSSIQDQTLFQNQAILPNQTAVADYLFAQAENIKRLLNNPTNTTPPQYTVLGNTGQTADTCGSYAVINAKAIQNLFDKNQPITTQALINEATPYKELCIRQNAAFDELKNLMRELNISIFSVDKQQNNQGFFITNALEDNTASRFFEFIDKIKKKQKAIGHFVINTGGHWMLISVVQKQGQSPHIYCTDTAQPRGGQINPGSVQDLFIKSIWGILK